MNRGSHPPASLPTSLGGPPRPTSLGALLTLPPLAPRGSYMMEALTQQLVDGALEIIDEVEDLGA